MTEQITVPRETWDAMREALKHGVLEMNLSGKAKECMPLHHALTAANAVSAKPLSKQLEGKDYPADWLEFADKMQAAKSVQPQAQGEARSLMLAKQQWESWKKYALELQERLVKYECGAPMLLNASHPQATEPAPSTAGEREEKVVSLPIPLSAFHLKLEIAELIQSHKYKGLRSIEVLGVFQFLSADIISGSST